MKRVAIVGGGIAGLSAAWYLEQHRRQGAQVACTLFESSPRLGGALLSERVGDVIVEGGPDSFLTEKPWAANLCRELGLGEQLIASNDPERKTFILVNGRLVELPDGLMFMVPTKILPTLLSPLFSIGTKLRMAAEWFTAPRRQDGDESVASLVARHYGPEMVERLADPLLAGVYGGSAAELSVRAVLPRFADMEARHGSLGRAMLAARKQMRQRATQAPRSLFTTVRGGMQQMGDAITRHLAPDAVEAGVRVESIKRTERVWRVRARDGWHDFDAVIVATPAWAAGEMLRDQAPALADELAAIAYSSSITLTLGFEREQVADLPPGFGFLVPRAERRRMLACTFVHNKFPQRVPPGSGVVRGFLGGSGDNEVLSWSDEQVIAQVRQELREILGFTAEPRWARVYRWNRAMAQYGVGHLERLQRIDGLRRGLPGLSLIGNAYRGIGVPDCVRGGQEAAEEIVGDL